MDMIEVAPLDVHNRELIEQTHPPDWKNPEPDGDYNLVAIGAGSAGIISALGAAGLGGKAALIERRLLGGDCLNFGCVPSKALIRAARAARQVRVADRFGVQVDGAFGVDFPAVMERMRRLRAEISHHDAAQRFTDMGVDVYLGEARFTGPQTLEVAGRELRFRRCVIATGARPTRPPIPGLNEVGYLTNESLFSITELPGVLAVVGGGPIGCEMAQAFCRFGATVHLVDTADRLLSRDDPAASQLIIEQFEREGIHLHFQSRVTRAERSEDNRKRLIVESAGGEDSIECDEILVAVGRTPNVEGLNLEAAGVAANERGIDVNDRLRSTNKRVFAAGDVAGSHQFTHAADAMARMVIQNAFFFGRKKVSKMIMPHATYTDPEVAQVGLTPEQAQKKGILIDSYREELGEVDRAILDSEADGFAVVHCRKGKGEIVGATIVGSHAGDMISEITALMTAGVKLGSLAGAIHCYPTQVEVLKRIADKYNRTRLTPLVAGLLRRILRWRR